MSQKNPSVELVSISQDQAGQRLDNFLFNRLRGVPRGHVYRLLRSGQVRVNSGRKKPHYRLLAGDEIRIPPVRVKPSQPKQVPAAVQQRLQNSILHEDEHLLVIDKPSGIPVHAGSGVDWGVIDALRASRPGETLELVHRLDRETSGCLLLARSRRALAVCHQAFRNEHAIGKHYLALVHGHWPGAHSIDAPIGKVMRSGERMMQVAADGQAALSHFECQTLYEGDHPATLMRVSIETGRTHQIRVHANAGGHPVAGDSKYGDREADAAMKRLGLDRLFLHAAQLELELPGFGRLSVSAALPAELDAVLEALA